MQSTHQKKKKGSSPNPNIAYPGRLHIQVDPYTLFAPWRNQCGNEAPRLADQYQF